MHYPAYCPNCREEFPVPVQIGLAERDTDTNGATILVIDFKTVRVRHECPA